MTRPSSIRYFEGAFWLWLGLNLAQAIVAWPATAADPNMTAVVARAPWFPYAILAVAVALLVWLGVATARRGAGAGRVIFTILTVISVSQVGYALAQGTFVWNIAGLLGLAAAVAAVVGTVLLFRPDASAWFATSVAEVDTDVDPV